MAITVALGTHLLAQPTPTVRVEFDGLHYPRTATSLVAVTPLPDRSLLLAYQLTSGQAYNVRYELATANVSPLAGGQLLHLRTSEGKVGAVVENPDHSLSLLIQALPRPTSPEPARQRLIPLPPPPTSSTINTGLAPYRPLPARVSAEDHLYLLHPSRDRLYHIAPPARGENTPGQVETLQPESMVEIIDFQVDRSGQVVLLDTLESRVMWLGLRGTTVAEVALPRVSVEGLRYLMSIAQAPGQTTYVGAAVRKPGQQNWVGQIIKIEQGKAEVMPLSREIAVPAGLAVDAGGSLFAWGPGGELYQLDGGQVRGPFVVTLPGDPPPPAETYFSELVEEIGGVPQLLSAAQTSLLTCYLDLLKVKPGASGSLHLQLDIRERKVRGVELLNSSIAGAVGVEACVSNTFMNLKPEEVRGSQKFQVTVHFEPGTSPLPK